MNEKIVTLIKKYVGAFLAMGSFTLAVLFLRDHFSVQDRTQMYLNLADAFTIPAVIMVMIGLLLWVSASGGFDMIGYGLKRAKDAFIPSKYTHEQYYDYKMRKSQKRIKGYSFMFISGGIYFVPAIIFNILYACV